MQVTRDLPHLFGRPGARQFGVLHRPPASAGGSRGGWLVCPAFGEERDTSQRVMLEWAETLVREGYHVLRFDYRGTGNGDPSPTVGTVEDYVRDAAAAAEELETLSGEPLVGVCGLRFGATVAALVARALERPLDLMLWEPVVEGRGYLTELLRAVSTAQMLRGERASTADLQDALGRGEALAVRGYPLSRALAESMAAVDLVASPPRLVRRALVVHISRTARGAAQPPHLARLAESLGGPSELVRAHGFLPWTLTNLSSDTRPPSLFGPSLEWLRRQPPPATGGRAAARTASPRPSRSGGAERVVEFRVAGHRVCGVLHLPEGRDRAAALEHPVVVTGVMSAIFPIEMARELGRHGWASLRFDPRGKGESEGELPHLTVSDNHFATQRGLLRPDEEAAIDFVQRELGARAVVLTGICGDALTAVLQAARDDRVVGLAPLELPLYRTLRRHLGEPSAAQRLRQSLLRLLPQDSRRGRLARQHVRPLVERAEQVVRRLLQGAPSAREDAAEAEQLATLLGERANLLLLEALLKCLRRQLPTLVLYGGSRPEGASGFERLVEPLERRLPGLSQWLRWGVVLGADHHFTAPDRREEVLRTLLEWLEDRRQPWQGASGRAAS